MVKPVSAENRQLAEHIARAFGGDFEVTEYLHDGSDLAVDILHCGDRPNVGVTSYATVGLSDVPIPWGRGEFATRIELAGACASSDKAFANLLASCAFHMMRGEGAFHPGAAIEGYVAQYFADSPLAHVYFTSPFLWDSLKTSRFGAKQVSWLLIVPISTAELRLLRSRGDEALEQRFEQHQIDVFDLHRRSVA
jgi:hypothetical protein